MTLPPLKKRILTSSFKKNSYSPLLVKDFRNRDKNNEKLWLIPGLIQKSALNLLSGQPKLGHKTYIAIHLGIALALKKSPFGIPAIQKPHKILFVENEGSAADFEKRLDEIGRGLGLTPEQIDEANLYIDFKSGTQLDVAEDRANLLNFIKVNQIDLLIIDSLSSSFGGDENNAKEVNAAIKTIININLSGCTVILLAHLVKKPLPTDDIDQNIRGSSHIAASYDTHIAVRDRKGTDGNFELKTIIRSRITAERDCKIKLQYRTNEEGAYDFYPRILFEKESHEFIPTATKDIGGLRKLKEK